MIRGLNPATQRAVIVLIILTSLNTRTCLGCVIGVFPKYVLLVTRPEHFDFDVAKNSIRFVSHSCDDVSHFSRSKKRCLS